MVLTAEETLIFRSLKRTAVVLMLTRYLDRPVGESDIADILDIDPKTARSHLRSLAALGLITRLHFHQGYQLTHAGRQMALPLEPVETQPDPALLEVRSPGEFPQSPGDIPPEEVLCSDSPVGGAPTCADPDAPSGERALFPVVPSEPGQPRPLHPGDFPGSLNIKIKDQESIDEINNNNSDHPGKKPASSELPPEKQPIHQIVVRSLAEYGILINDRTRRLLGKITCDDIMSVANDLEAQGKLKETGLFVIHLEQRVTQGLANWQAVYGPPSVEFNPLEAYWQPDESEYSRREAVTHPVDLTDFEGPTEIGEAWCAAVEQARGELPMVAFDTWLAPARPLAWDAERETLTVGVVNSYARDYLDEQVKDILLPYLAGVLNSRRVWLVFETC